MTLLLKLLLAHLIGDFILQPNTWVKAKEGKKLAAWQLYIHTMLHGVLIVVLVWDIQFLLPAVIITLSHGIIDGAKLLVQKESTKRIWFAIDQLLHVAVIVAVWVTVENPVFALQFSNENLAIITALVFLTSPASVMIKMLISQWTPIAGPTDAASLQHAGKFIGILERLMVFTFAITNNWQAIGFLIAAKSIFRFGDLKDSHDLKLTEYVLIGTLLSFGIAIAAALLVSKAT
jgi:hypothetical protein